jgi:hypothetical protein
MKKIGIAFMLFGFFFPMILTIFTDFSHSGWYWAEKPEGLISCIQSGKIVVRGEARIEYSPSRYRLGAMHVDYSPDYLYIPYSYALAFSIVVFAVGIGFLLLSEPKKGGGSFR